MFHQETYMACACGMRMRMSGRLTQQLSAKLEGEEELSVDELGKTTQLLSHPLLTAFIFYDFILFCRYWGAHNLRGVHGGGGGQEHCACPMLHACTQHCMCVHACHRILYVLKKRPKIKNGIIQYNTMGRIIPKRTFPKLGWSS